MGNEVLLRRWEQVRGSFWFIPAVMALGSMVFAFLLPFIDNLITAEGVQVPRWVYGGGAQGARSLLSTIAGSMITVASLIFSITLIALSMAAQQYGPRLLNTFMRDPVYQVVMGTFVANFIYSLLVVRQIQDVDGDLQVPRLAVTFAVFLAILALAFLIYFFHHAPASIRADILIKNIGNDLFSAVDRAMKKDRDEAENEERSTDREQERYPEGALMLEATKTGYLQSVDAKRLKKVAADGDLVFRIGHRKGTFITEGEGLIEVWPPEQLRPEVLDKVHGAFGFGTQSFLPTEIDAPLSELVEIAVRSLSPTLNTPNTVIACIDQLARGLRHMAELIQEAEDEGQSTAPHHFVDGRLRLVTARMGFAEMVDMAFDQIRYHARDMPSVNRRLLEALIALSRRAPGVVSQTALLEQATMINEAGEQFSEARYRREIFSLYMRLRDSLEKNSRESYHTQLS